ncbi:MAG: hypothetical protein RL456_201 [Pseudomonadota bacterium]|jgi:FKBP-type peptidyl-prolyl cis-trans isomerase SlyD
MHIQAPCVVSLIWRLEDAQGELIDEMDEPIEFFFGGQDLLPAVEQALEGQDTGHERTLRLEPEQAFGDYDAGLVFFEERSVLPEGVDEGMRFEGPPPGSATPGMPADVIYTVTEVYDTHVVLDGNHPLAGIGLVIKLSVRGVRPATEEEIAQGTVGDPEGGLFSLGSPPGSTLH